MQECINLCRKLFRSIDLLLALGRRQLRLELGQIIVDGRERVSEVGDLDNLFWFIDELVTVWTSERFEIWPSCDMLANAITAEKMIAL